MNTINEIEGSDQWEDDQDRISFGRPIFASFTTSLWSEKESEHSRTVDSWDLPSGAIPWDENDKPIEKLLSYADLNLTDEEENGVLTDRIVAACSSYLTESPGNRCHIVAKVTLNNKNLNNIRILGYHRFLQYVDLSWNNLTDLTPLGCLPYLMYLDVSHNLLEDVLCFRAPLNLTYVNFSYNEVWHIGDLTDFWALCFLDLSHNKISKIQGLHELRYLRHLDLSHNRIERFENLNGLGITDLNLEYNLISKFEQESNCGMKTLPHLLNVYLNNNNITNLDFLKGVSSLKSLELQENNISDLLELITLKPLIHLRFLDLSGNLVSELKPYRNLVLSLLPDLKFLNQTEVEVSERVIARKKTRFDLHLAAARNNARMTILEQLNSTSLDLDVMPIDQGAYPFVIIVGPSASSKKYITSLLGEKYPDKIYIGKLHTTREVLNSEKNVLVHMNKEEFNEEMKAGKFLCVNENLGQLYGFSRQELARAVKEHKLCLTSMDMVSALTIHSYGIQPFLILAIPKNKQDHKDRLKKNYGPVFFSFGAAYLAHRQLTSTHASNVKRVEVILNDILTDVLQRVCQAMDLFPESLGRFSRSSESVEQTVLTDSDSNADFTFYYSNKGCFACSPTKCGYQTHLIAGSDDIPHFLKTRLSASIASLRPEETSTSYSAMDSPPIKIHMSSDAESICGECNQFISWSMPFIDWSEVNMTSAQLEEAAEILCEKYIENVMLTRNAYENLHVENPGLFSLTMFIDDTEKAVKDITKFLKEVWRSSPERAPTFDVENDVVYKAFVPQKLKKLKEMLRNDFYSDGDGSLKGITSVAPINSPASICAEMHLKGYGQDVEELKHK